MKSFFHKLLVVVCALYLSGAHWAVLQTTAWTGMLVARTQESGVMQAVQTTFDGQHPCKLCNVISEGSKKENRQEVPTPSMKQLLEINLTALEDVKVPSAVAGSSMRWPDFLGMSVERMDAPPTPPPQRS